MGRFFQTAPTQFVEDYIYQPPWELMDKVAAIKQAEYDSVAQKTDLLNNALLQIKHLNGETDVANVKEIQRYYNDQINQITEHARNNPQDATALQRNIDKLQKEMLQDFTAGNISKIQGSYNAYEQFRKDNEQLKKDNPSRYTAGEKYYLGQYAEAGGDSIYNQQFKGEAITKDVDWQKLYDSVDKLKASEWTQQSAGASGGYIYKNKQTGETVTADRINGYLMSRLLTPENMAALQQSQQYGLARYFDDQGKLDEMAPGFAGVKGVALNSAYSKNTIERDMQSDSTYNSAQQRALTYQMHKEDMANNNYWKGVERADKLAAEANKGKLTDKDLFEMRMDILEETDPAIKQLKQQEYDNLVGVQFNTAIDKKLVYKDIYGAVRNKNLSGTGDVVGQARNAARGYLKTVEKSAGKDFANAFREMYNNIDAAIASGKIKNEKDIERFTRDYLIKRYPGDISNRPSLNFKGVLTPGAVASDPGLRKKLATQQKYDIEHVKINNDYVNAAKEYVTRQNTFITNYANNASSQKVFEVPSTTSSSQAIQIIKNNPQDFIITYKDGKGKTQTSKLLPEHNIKINGVTSGQSYGPLGISATVQDKEVYILPSGAGASSLSTQVLTKVLASGLRSDSAIRAELENIRVQELQQAESRAKVSENGISTFTYKTGNKDFRIQYDGKYQVYDNFGNPLSSVPADNLLALSKFIDLNLSK